MTFLKVSALVAYPVQVVWLDFTKKRKKYTADLGHAVLDVLSVEATELRDGDGQQNIDKVCSCTNLHLRRWCLCKTL